MAQSGAHDDGSSIIVPMQRAYTGTKFILYSSLADTPWNDLGVDGLLDRLNTTLGTSYTLDSPSISSALEDCIAHNHDFGTAHAHLRGSWQKWDTMQAEMRRREARARDMRQEALVGNRIVQPYMVPRRIWDLYSNRERVEVQTPINGYEWPVPIPKDTNLDRVRTEMLNLGLEYVWLDVFCLRQNGGPGEALRAEEWKVDVPTIGHIYNISSTVCCLSGLGRPLSLNTGTWESDRSWFRRAWTLQEPGRRPVIAGDTPDGPLHARPIDKEENYRDELLTRFHKQLRSLDNIKPMFSSVFQMLADIQNRVSTNPVDKVAGLSFPLMSGEIPAYYEKQSVEDAWTELVNTMIGWNRRQLFFLYPAPGNASRKWCPSWEQVMTTPLPVDRLPTKTEMSGEACDDWYEGFCIESGFVRGLAVGDADGVNMQGELVVEDANGKHKFNIIAAHQYPIPEDSYVLIGEMVSLMEYWVVGRRLPEKRFEKVSVFKMTEDKEKIKMLDDLSIAIKSRSLLV
ncbi:hypothetical protein ARMGADRAFT_1065775 [Armillaria gallica]|uniref:Heterokaryon incompatibility domain-containing protein n=1 Tax=Armillaria gallica TaxID=47427 RepID=A0A2H3CYM8_ARMGA|nr:hypothetical protein ARMGADRAFT_1065775 [Armillaria gallica]